MYQSTLRFPIPPLKHYWNIRGQTFYKTDQSFLGGPLKIPDFIIVEIS